MLHSRCRSVHQESGITGWLEYGWLGAMQHNRTLVKFVGGAQPEPPASASKELFKMVKGVTIRVSAPPVLVATCWIGRRE